MKKALSILLSLVFIASILIIGSNGRIVDARSNAQGVDSKSVKVGTLGPVSGPLAIVGIPMLHGMQSYFDMVNDAGGVNGRKIELISKDDGFRADLAIQKSEELVEDDGVFSIVGQLGTPGCLATISYFKEIGIPCVYQGSGMSKYSTIKKNYFPVQPNYHFEGGLMANYAINTLKAKKIVVLYENADIGKEGLQGIKDGLAKLRKGACLRAAISYNPTELDFSTHVRTIALAKPDIIIMYGNIKPCAGIALEVKKQGLKAQLMGSYIVADVSAFALAKDAWNNVITLAWVPDITDSSNVGAKKFVDTFLKYFPKETPNAYAVAGWVAAEVFTEGLKRCGNDLSWSNYIASMEKFNNWSGDIATGITYTKLKRNGVEKMYFMKAQYTDEKNYKYIKISGFVSATK